MLQQTLSVHPYRYFLDLTWNLVQRDFILRYKGSMLGVLWALLVPLTHLLVLVFIFVKVVPLNISAYPAFVFTALLPWTWFSNCITSAGGLFINNRDLIRRPNFPPLILIVVNTFSNLLLYLIVLPLVFATIFAYGEPLHWTVIYLPILLIVQSILITALSTIVATFNVFYRDIQQMVNIMVMLVFYITPVFYRARAVDERYQILFDINPIAALIKSYRETLFYGRPPEWSSLLYCFFFTAMIGAIGYVVYKRKIDAVIDGL